MCKYYVQGKRAKSENNQADYTSRHPEPLARQERHASSRQAEFKLRETEGEFEKDIMTTVISSLPEAVTWQELLEPTLADTELSNLEEAIARGYLTTRERHLLGLQHDFHLHRRDRRRGDSPRSTNSSFQVPAREAG